MDKDQIKLMMKTVYELLGDPELVEAIANMSWNLFSKLKEKGFTDDQAIQIVGRWASNTGVKN